jgi:hypothetical protein
MIALRDGSAGDRISRADNDPPSRRKANDVYGLDGGISSLGRSAAATPFNAANSATIT